MRQKDVKLNIDPYWFLEATVHQEGNNIFNLAYRLCRDREEAKEIARAAFLKTLENYRCFESRFQIYIFLCRTTFGIWKNSARRRTRYPAQPLHSSGPIGSEAIAADPSGRGLADQTIFLNEIGKKEQLEVIRKGLTGLPAPDNFIIVLRDVEGKSYLEIACILKCRYHMVKSRLAQARKRLHANILPDLENQK